MALYYTTCHTSLEFNSTLLAYEAINGYQSPSFGVCTTLCSYSAVHLAVATSFPFQCLLTLALKL